MKISCTVKTYSIEAPTMFGVTAIKGHRGSRSTNGPMAKGTDHKMSGAVVTSDEHGELEKQ